jgi:hypothetical protein
MLKGEGLARFVPGPFVSSYLPFHTVRVAASYSITVHQWLVLFFDFHQSRHRSKLSITLPLFPSTLLRKVTWRPHTHRERDPFFMHLFGTCDFQAISITVLGLTESGTQRSTLNLWFHKSWNTFFFLQHWGLNSGPYTC